MGIPEKLEGIRREDIPELARHADKEANPLYPVPVLMGAKELEKFYNRIMAEEKPAGTDIKEEKTGAGKNRNREDAA